MEDKVLNIGYIDWLNDNQELKYFKNLVFELGLDVTKKLNLYLISHIATKDDIMDLTKYFNKIFYCQSYKHTKFTNEFAKDINVGIIPSIIKDNISQAAIEFTSRKIPILCGNKGGECQLCNSKMFTFDTENIKDLKEKLEYFIYKPEKLNEYWLEQNEVAVEFVKQ